MAWIIPAWPFSFFPHYSLSTHPKSRTHWLTSLNISFSPLAFLENLMTLITCNNSKCIAYINHLIITIPLKKRYFHYLHYADKEIKAWTPAITPGSRELVFNARQSRAYTSHSTSVLCFLFISWQFDPLTKSFPLPLRTVSLLFLLNHWVSFLLAVPYFLPFNFITCCLRFLKLR